MRRLQETQRVELGFDADHVLVLSYDLNALGYADAPRRAFHEELRARIEHLPGIRSATVPAYVPLDGGAALFGIRAVDDDGATGGAAAAAGRSGAAAAPDRPLVTPVVGIAPGYFRTLGIPLRRGRDFTEDDLAETARSVIVSADLARRLWPGADPVGRRSHLGIGGRVARAGADADDAPDDATIVDVIAVAGDIPVSSVNEPRRALVYRPHTRHFEYFRTDVAIRFDGDPAAAVRAIRDELRRMDPALPVFDVRTLAQVVDREIGVQRRLTGVIASFGLAALLLATLGLYGVIAYTVAGRTHEIGVRVALGADAGDVIRLFLRDGLRLTALGLAAGLAAAITRFVASLVFDVRPLDPATIAVTAATLSLAAALAAYLPARRAARVDPMQALRGE